MDFIDKFHNEVEIGDIVIVPIYSQLCEQVVLDIKYKHTLNNNIHIYKLKLSVYRNNNYVRRYGEFLDIENHNSFINVFISSNNLIKFSKYKGNNSLINCRLGIV